MSRYEPYAVAAFDSLPKDLSKPALPYHLVSAHQETLISWLTRFAMRLGISLQTLLKTTQIAASGADDPTWWLRPEQKVLMRIGDATGTDSDTLANMTFIPWQPAVRHHDEIGERFCPDPELPAVKRRRRSAHRIAVCTQCLHGDEEPYLRLSWTLTWAALCPQHATVLIRCCPRCRANLKMGELISPHTPLRCIRCQFPLGHTDPQPAAEQALQLQNALLAAKRSGHCELAGLGVMSWLLATAVLETLLRLALTPGLAHQQLYRYIRDRFSLGEQFDAWDSPYGILLLSAWMLDRWPRNSRACLSLLRASGVSPHIQLHRHLPDHIRGQLQEIFRPFQISTRRRCRQQNRNPPWRSWLNNLPMTADELRFRAYRERLQHRRVRLIALTWLREGRSIKVVANAIRMRPATVSDWLQEGLKNGLEALLERRRGRQLLSSAQIAQIAEWLASQPLPGATGFRRIHSSDVVAESAARFGVRITPEVALKLLRAHGASRRWRRRRPYPIQAMDSRMREPVQN